MENKNLNWIINKIQTEMFEEKMLESHYKAFEKFNIHIEDANYSITQIGIYSF